MSKKMEGGGQTSEKKMYFYALKYKRYGPCVAGGR